MVIEPKPAVADILPHIRKFDCVVTAAGVWLGSLLYLGFGPAYPLETWRGFVDDYPIILEFGADRWSWVERGLEIENSDFEDIRAFRELAASRLIGRTVLDVTVSDGQSTVSFSGDGSIISEIQPDPASGFLYHFRVIDGPSWDTVDGSARLT